jgi:hypothetical protein
MAFDRVYRCAGPNCGSIKDPADDDWWLMSITVSDEGDTILSLRAWNKTIADTEGPLYLCGEGCAGKMMSQFMSNLRENRLRRAASK